MSNFIKPEASLAGENGIHVERGNAISVPRCRRCRDDVRRLCDIATQVDGQQIKPGSPACLNTFVAR
jgi:hypothetical protein